MYQENWKTFYEAELNKEKISKSNHSAQIVFFCKLLTLERGGTDWLYHEVINQGIIFVWFLVSSSK